MLGPQLPHGVGVIEMAMTDKLGKTDEKGSEQAYCIGSNDARPQG